MRINHHANEVTSEAIETYNTKFVAACKMLSAPLFVFACCSTILPIIVVVFYIASFAVPSIAIVVTGSLCGLLPAVVGYCLVLSLVWTLWAFARSATQYGTLFSAASRRGLLLLSLLYFVSAVLELIPKNSVSLLIEIADMSIGFVTRSSDGGSISVGSFGAALMFAMLASVFKYGSLLQRVSDDTV